MLFLKELDTVHSILNIYKLSSSDLRTGLKESPGLSFVTQQEETEDTEVSNIFS